MHSKQPAFILVVDLIVCMFILSAAASVISASYGAYFAYRSLLGMRDAVSGLASVHAETGAVPDTPDVRCPDGFEIVWGRSSNVGAVSFRTFEIRHGISIAPPVAARRWTIRARP